MDSIEIDLILEETQESFVNVSLEVFYSIEPTEYEYGYVFYQGGYVIEEIKVSKDFTFLDTLCKKGDSFPEGLVPYIIEPKKMESYEYFEIYITELLYDTIGSPPSQHYSMRY
jgi:hypothetical protein